MLHVLPPSLPTRRSSAVLSRLAWRGLAPAREVSGVALALDGIDAAFAFIAAGASEAAISGHRRRVEIEAAVEFVAMLFGDRFREFDHLRHIVGRDRPMRGLAAVEGLHVGPLDRKSGV